MRSCFIRKFTVSSNENSVHHEVGVKCDAKNYMDSIAVGLRWSSKKRKSVHHLSYSSQVQWKFFWKDFFRNPSRMTNSKIC